MIHTLACDLLEVFVGLLHVSVDLCTDYFRAIMRHGGQRKS